MPIANAGLPMIFVELPFLAAAFVPVVVLETAFFCWRLSLSWRQSGWGALRANLWSTFVGVPLAWLAQVIGQLVVGGGSAWGLDTPLSRLAAVTVQSAWLIPYRGEFDWMVPAASLFLLLPCLLVSVYVEQRLLRRYWPELPGRQVFGATVAANLITYVLLACYWGVKLSLALGARHA